MTRRKTTYSLLRYLACVAILILGLASIIGTGSSSSVAPTDSEETLRPVLFIHGGAGSASQFESQAQRFMANGYPLGHLAVFEYHGGDAEVVEDPEKIALANERINQIIDSLLASTGADKINLIGHSRGTGVSFFFLSEPANAQRVANYVAVDGMASEAPPGGVPTLALWGQYVTREVVGAVENVYPDSENPVGHIEVCTAEESFIRMYRFFNGEEPAISHIPQSEEDQVWIAGRATLFPQNVGAAGTTLKVYEVDRDTGFILPGTPEYETEIDATGDWGPVLVTKGATYMFALERDGSGNDHYFYREAFYQDNYFIRLNTSEPEAGVGQYLHRSPNHTNIMVTRDKEFWGDQGDNNDVLFVRDTGDLGPLNIVTEETAFLLNRTNTLFLHDRNSDQESTLPGPDPFFSQIPFMSGLDLYIPASEQPNRTIRLELTPRGGGKSQVINVPNWPSDAVRSISVMFRDYSEPVRPVVFVHGFAGSASQFESQAQRFMANGYPLRYLVAYDHDTSGAVEPQDQVLPLDDIIDTVLADTGAVQVDLIGHSRGTRVSQAYLADPERAAKVANYVNVDGYPAAEPPGGVPTLALWGDGFLFPDTFQIPGALNIRHSDQAHIEVATSRESFVDMYTFFNGREPVRDYIPEIPGQSIEVAGAVNYFPTNVGAPGTLEMWEINPATAVRIGTPVAVFTIDGSGAWGPLWVDRGATYEFAFEHASGEKHYFYREANEADNFFMRLNTSDPGDEDALGAKLSRSMNHTNILITRDKEIWGNQGALNDSIEIDGHNVLDSAAGELAGARTNHLSGLFIMDWGQDKEAEPGEPGSEADQTTDLIEPIKTFHDTAFMSGLDVYIPAADPWNQTIEVRMTPRGGGPAQIVNVPNWPSEEVRVSVHFRDFVQ